MNSAVSSEAEILDVLMPEEGTASRWVQLSLRFWRFIFLAFVLLTTSMTWKGWLNEPAIGPWLVCYAIYLAGLELFRHFFRQIYVSPILGLVRAFVDSLFIFTLLLAVPPGYPDYLWVFFTMPILAAIRYKRGLLVAIGAFAIICCEIIVAGAAMHPNLPAIFITSLVKCTLIGLMTALLFLTVRFIPQLQSQKKLIDTTQVLVGVLDRRELAQLIADAAKGGIRPADACVVHLVSREDKRTLEPVGSSNLDVTTFSKSPMEIGIGVAGRAIETHNTINVADVRGHEDFHPIPPGAVQFGSLLVAPMFIGEKNIGTISVSSVRRGAFGKADERFLTALATQGALTIRNADLVNTGKHRRQQTADILKASLSFHLTQPYDLLLQSIARAVCRCTDFRSASVILLTPDGAELNVKALEGVSEEGIQKLHNLHIPLAVIQPLLNPDFLVSGSYFIRHDRRPDIPQLSDYLFARDLGWRHSGQWHSQDILIVPLRTAEDRLLGYISVDDPTDQAIPSLDKIQGLEVLAAVAATAIENAQLMMQVDDARQKAKRDAQVLHLLNRISIISQGTVDLDRILNMILTGVTDKDGLRLNRAALFLYDEKTNCLEGLVGVGQLDHELARQTWEEILSSRRTLDEHLEAVLGDAPLAWTELHTGIRGMRIPLRSDSGAVLAAIMVSKTAIVLEGAPTASTLPESLVRAMDIDGPVALVPLVARRRVVGLLVCDSKYTRDPLPPTLELLATFANLAAASIENATLFKQTLDAEKAREREKATRTERRRLEDSLHEAMGVLATGVKWEAEILQDELTRGRMDQVSVALSRLQASLNRGYSDLRYLLEDLRDPILENEGLLNALRNRAELIGAGRIRVTSNFEGRLPVQQEAMMYRVALEAMNNAVKYSGVTNDSSVEISVRLVRIDDQVTLCVKDTGLGFDLQMVLNLPQKWGLRRLYEIAKEGGGDLKIVSELKGGTTVCVSVKLTPEDPCNPQSES